VSNLCTSLFVSLPEWSPTLNLAHTWAHCHKYFYVRYFEMFVISYSVCPWQTFPD